MSSLASAFGDPQRRDAILRDAATLLHGEVNGKRGLRGAALRTAFRAFQAIRPGIVEAALRRLMPLFIPALEPHWEVAKGEADPRQAFERRDQEVAEALLSVTDDLATRAKNRAMVRLYRSLRSSAVRHVQDAVPALGALLEKHDPPVPQVP